MKITTRDLLAPANFVTIGGLVLTIWGSLHLDALGGLVTVTIGRCFDMLDGFVARKTHASRFGAVLDATTDKFSILAIVTGMLAFRLAPMGIILYILLQNAVTATVNMIASHRKHVVSSSIEGKRNVFLQNVSMLTFACSHVSHGNLRGFWLVLAYATLIISIYFALAATIGYMARIRTNHKTTTDAKPHDSI